MQVPAFAGTDDHISTLAGFIVCIITLAAYCIFQVGNRDAVYTWKLPRATVVCAVHAQALLSDRVSTPLACCHTRVRKYSFRVGSTMPI